MASLSRACFPRHARARREDVEEETVRFGGIQKNKSSICCADGGEEAVAADESVDLSDDVGVFYSIYVFLGRVSQSPDTGSSVGLQQILVR